MTISQGWPLLTRVSRRSATLAVAVLTAAAMFAGGPGSAKLPLLIVLATGLCAVVLWSGVPLRRLLLGALFFTAPLDISKALVAPLEQFYSPGLYVTVGEATAVALALLWAAEQVFRRRQRLPFTGLDALAMGFLALVWIGALHAAAGKLAYASAVSYSLCVLGFYVASHTLRSQSDVRLVLGMVMAGFCFETLYVAAQMATHTFLTLPGAKVAPVGTQGVLYEAEQIAAFRPIGSFDHPNALADYLTLILPSALGFVLMSRKRLPPHVYGGAAFILAAGTTLLLLTLSRGGWAAYAVGASFVALIYLRRGLIGSGHVLALAGVLLAVVIAVVAVFPQIVLRVTEPDGRSLESRVVLTDQAFTIIKSHPLFGVGYGGYNRAAFEHIPPSFALISDDYHKQLLQLVVHNHYLLVASELGLPAMLYWIFLLTRFIRQAWPLTCWRDPGMFALGIGLAAALISQMLYLASDNYYTDIRIFMLWLTAGVLQALRLIADGATRPTAFAEAASPMPGALS